MQAAVRNMIARGAAGTVVNIITMSSYGGQPFLAPYSASKAGLVGLTAGYRGQGLEKRDLTLNLHGPVLGASLRF